MFRMSYLSDGIDRQSDSQHVLFRPSNMASGGPGGEVLVLANVSVYPKSFMTPSLIMAKQIGLWLMAENSTVLNLMTGWLFTQ